MDLNKLLLDLQEMQTQLWNIIKFHDIKPELKIGKFWVTQKPDAHLLVLLRHYQSICNTIDEVKHVIDQKQTQDLIKCK